MSNTRCSIAYDFVAFSNIGKITNFNKTVYLQDKVKITTRLNQKAKRESKTNVFDEIYLLKNRQNVLQQYYKCNEASIRKYNAY